MIAVKQKLAIAQLVERWTVALQLKSIGHWFDSGSREFYLMFLPHIHLTILFIFIVTDINIIISNEGLKSIITRDSSVGRAVDCSDTTDIHRSLVRFRFARLVLQNSHSFYLSFEIIIYFIIFYEDTVLKR